MMMIFRNWIATANSIAAVSGEPCRNAPILR